MVLIFFFPSSPPHCKVIVYSNSFEQTTTFAHAASRVLVRPFEPLMWIDTLLDKPEFRLLREWFESPASKSGFMYNNLANAARLILLYMHGGTYVDLDVPALRPLRELSEITSIVGWESTDGDIDSTAEDKAMVNSAQMINFPPLFFKINYQRKE